MKYSTKLSLMLIVGIMLVFVASVVSAEEAEATLNLEGNYHKVISAGDINSNDFPIKIDMNGDGVIGNYRVLEGETVVTKETGIQKDNYFIIRSHTIVKYLGASIESKVMRFKDIQTNEIIEVVYQISGSGYADGRLNVKGLKDIRVVSSGASKVTSDDFPIDVDTDVSGSFGNTIYSIVLSESDIVTVKQLNYILLQDNNGYTLLEYIDATNHILSFLDDKTGGVIALTSRYHDIIECKDSDGGKIYDKYGSLSIKYSDLEYDSSGDYCGDNYKLYEKYCKSLSKAPAITDILNERQTKSYTIDGKEYEVTLNEVTDNYDSPIKAKFIINGEVTSSLSVGERYTILKDMIDIIITQIEDLDYKDSYDYDTVGFMLSNVKGVEAYNCPNGCKDGACITTSTNQPPIISGVSGPQILKPSETGTWIVKAYDNDGSYLYYKVDWGDYTVLASSSKSQVSSTSSPQQTTFTHTYSTAGTYTVTFTVTDEKSASAVSSVTVTVSSSNTQIISLYQVSTNEYKGDYYESGLLYKFTIYPEKQYLNVLYDSTKESSDVAMFSTGNNIYSATWYKNGIGYQIRIDLNKKSMEITAGSSSNPCTDSDGGKNYYTKGSISLPNRPNYYWDGCYEKINEGYYSGVSSCTGENCYLNEMYCATPQSDSASSEYYKCPNFCKDGVCVSSQDTSNPKPNPPIDLSNYPNMFMKDGKFKVVLVVGDYGSPSDVVSTVDIAISLGLANSEDANKITSQEKNEVIIKKIDIGAIKLASEISEPTNTNLISVGSPCVNSVSAKLLGNPDDCIKGFTVGEGKIKLSNLNGYAQILVAGITDDDTGKSAKVLANWKEYKLEGSDIRVLGTYDKPVIVSKIQQPPTTDSADLQVTNIETQSSLHSGGNIYLSAEIANVGSKSTSTTEKLIVTWYVDGKEIYREEQNWYIVPLKYNGGTPNAYAWWYGAEEGIHEVKVRVDAPNLIETTKENNVFTKTFKIVQSSVIDIEEVYIVSIDTNTYALYVRVDSDNKDNLNIYYKVGDLSGGNELSNYRGNTKFQYDNKENAFLVTHIQKSQIAPKTYIELTMMDGNERDSFRGYVSSLTHQKTGTVSGKIEGSTVCSADVKQCPDGSYVSRDPNKNCEFKQCYIEARKEIREPRRIEGKELSINLYKGWNLVSLPSKLISFGRLTSGNKFVGFVFIKEQQKFVSLKQATSILGGNFGEYLSENGFWIYSYSDTSMTFIISEIKENDDDIMIVKGWNFVPIMEDMVESQLEDLKGDCRFEKSYLWNPSLQEWESMREDFTFLPQNINTAFLVKSAGECGFYTSPPEVNGMQPPNLPE